MALGTWNPFEELDQLHRQIDRAFRGAGNDRWDWPYSRFSFLPGRSTRTYPLINIGEDTDNVRVQALAPGVDPDSLKVSVVRDQLTIEGEKPPADKDVKPEAYHRNERATGRFVRTLTLPVEIDAKGVKAEYRNGLLNLTLPKAAAAKPLRIDVSVN